MFYGLDFIATVPPSVRLTAQAFGREQAPLVFGWIFAAHQLGAGLMAFAAGISRDLLASYLPAFFAAGLLCIAAALSLLLWLLKGRSGPAVLAPEPLQRCPYPQPRCAAGSCRPPSSPSSATAEREFRPFAATAGKGQFALSGPS